MIPDPKPEPAASSYDPMARERITTLIATCDQLQLELSRNAQVTWMLWLAVAGLLGVAVVHHRRLVALLAGAEE